MFALDDLISIMKAVGGADEKVDLDGDIADTVIAELGFDSLAILEIESQVGLQHEIRLPDNTITTAMTAREAVSRIASLAGAEV